MLLHIGDPKIADWTKAGVQSSAKLDPWIPENDYLVSCNGALVNTHVFEKTLEPE